MKTLIKTRIELQVGLLSIAFITLLVTSILSVSQAFAQPVDVLHDASCEQVITDADIAACYGDYEPSQVAVMQ